MELPAASIYVTLAVARRYAFQRGLELEEARRELTVYLHRAHCTREATDTDPARVRYQSRHADIDIDLSAKIVYDPPLFVVVSVNARRARNG